jgi:phosphatidylethanolamine-binding protein (PEBP) family uncharacterized protein
MVCLLLQAGCGGEDSASETQASGQASSSAPSADEAQGQGRDASTGKASSPKAAANESGSGPSSSSGSSGTKQGPAAAQLDGEREPDATAAQRANATVANITLESPSLPRGAVPALPSTYTCDSEETWPALTWSGVPSGTVELALLMVNTQPVDGRLFFDWAVTGLDPSLTSIESDKLPSGAVVGRNGAGKIGYSLCPPQGSSETYFFTLYALPEHLEMTRGFDPIALREAALDASHNAGILAVSYSRE